MQQLAQLVLVVTCKAFSVIESYGTDDEMHALLSRFNYISH